jgi:hypothetical protein
MPGDLKYMLSSLANSSPEDLNQELGSFHMA